MRRLFMLTETGGGVVDGLFDSRDMEPRVRFGGLDDGWVREDDDEDEEDRFSSALSPPALDPPPPEEAAPVEGSDSWDVACAVAPVLVVDCPAVPFVECDDDDVLLLLLLCFSCPDDNDDVVVVVVVIVVATNLLVCPSTSAVASPPTTTTGFFRWCSNSELNSASGSANSFGSLGKGSGSISSSAAKLYIVLRWVHIASVVMSRLSALDSRSDMQAMKKYLFMPTGFSPSSARNNWISLSGLHSSPSARSFAVAVALDDMVIV